MRLQKYIAEAGHCSRRKAEELIARGAVKVNGLRIEKMGVQVEDGDKVEVEGVLLGLKAKNIYLMLNKPAGYVTSCRSFKGQHSILDLLPPRYDNFRLYPVGRLDKDTEGLLILTNDGQFANNVMHPRNQKEKEYFVKIQGRIKSRDLVKLAKGVRLSEEEITSRAKIQGVLISQTFTELRMTIQEGMNRQIRRMFDVLDYRVIYLKRFRIGRLEIGNLRKGEVREFDGKL